MNARISLDDKYTAREGRIFLTGTQALVRLPMTQMRRDRAEGANTAAFISGYRGSPLGTYDMQLMQAKHFLTAEGVVFQPGLNEDLAATAVWGSQQVPLSHGAQKEGVLGIWYGKGPGVDRSGDVFKHANAAGSSRLGGVLAIAGDDHTCKSSSIPHQSDHAFISALIPYLYPSTVQEFLEMGLLGIAMSRYSGCWIGYKVISDTVETSASVDLAQESRRFVIPTDFELPADGLNLRWPDPPLVQDARLEELKGYAAIAFARANRVDQIVIDSPRARFGIVASGKAYEDVLQAFEELDLHRHEWEAIGLRLYKVRMPWPLEPEGIRHFSEGLEEVLVVEERREIIENQLKQQLFNWRLDVRPRIVGKFDERDRPFLSHSAGLTVSTLARAIAERVMRLELSDGLAGRIAASLARIAVAEARSSGSVAPVVRLPHFCAGCPHNISTQVPEGSVAMAGIGCHYMAQWMDRRTAYVTQMGGEGVPWSAIRHFTDEKHRFANLGDGTYFHSGLLAIRQSVAAKAPITYKILYNDAVAMTGGQPIDGELTPAQVTRQLHAEGVARIVLLSEHPEAYDRADLAPGTELRHRDVIDAVMKDLREVPDVTAMVYVQTCAAELRRKRSRGLAEDPDIRVWINPAVCEGCGDCSVQSNCIAIEPEETELGRKRRINQSACNKDISCIKGFCPSFVTVTGARLHKSRAVEGPEVTGLPDPLLPALDRPWNIAVTGVGGTGVLTIGALIGMAAHIQGLRPLILDMAGLAQKGGAVLSHIRISDAEHPPTAPRIAAGRADLLLAVDVVVAGSKEGVVLCDPARTHAVVNTRLTPVSDFVHRRDFDFRQMDVEATVAGVVRSPEHFRNFSDMALTLCGTEIAANIMMLGFAWQKALIPVGREAIAQAIVLNGVAAKANQMAFDWGRLLAHDPVAIRVAPRPKPVPQAEMATDDLIRHRAAHLTAWQDARLAMRYRQWIETLRQTAHAKGIDAEATVRAAATAYAKVLAYKDEYEVARLYSDPAFRAALKEEFDGDLRLTLNFAPPFLPGKDAQGRPRKRAFGPWILPLLRVLARLKGLRGTPFDPFGRSLDRRTERAIIAHYEADLDLVAKRLSTATVGDCVALLSWPQEVRGYGPVKQAAYTKAMARRDDLRASIGRNNTTLPAAKAQLRT